MQELIADFVVEAGENLEQIDLDLLRLEGRPADATLLNGIFRLLHTLKVASGFLGLNRLQAVAHAGEALLDLYRRSGDPMPTEAFDGIVAAIDRVRRLLKALGETGAEPDGDDADLLHHLAALETGTPSVLPPEVRAPPSADPSAVTGPDETWGAPANSVRVDLNLLEAMMRLTSELVLSRNQLLRLHGETRDDPYALSLQRLSTITSALQDTVMPTRMRPMGLVWKTLPRLVRELSRTLGKEVAVELSGAGTEIDRQLLEAVRDPILHMIRNAVDHGLEKPEVRIAAGKPEQGEVRLSAAHRSGRVVIEVSDDGAGIDRARVKSIAIRKGLIPADAQLTDSEIDNLLFLPGFSTAETVSSISGRGVGMDVVKRSIQALGGRISISSRPGLGSTFSMSLPLTLAVLDGMVVKVADQTLVVPLTTILETLKPKLSDVYGLGPDSQVIGIRGGFTPLIDVARALGFRHTRSDPLSGVTLLIETEGGVRSALMVDAIQDQRQVVIKSLEVNYGHVEGIAAATILGDGRIALILDADAIVTASNRGSGSETLLAATG